MYDGDDKERDLWLNVDRDYTYDEVRCYPICKNYMYHSVFIALSSNDNSINLFLNINSF